MTTKAEPPVPATESAPKPKRKPPKVDPLSPHAVRLAVVGRLVSPESLKQKGAWGRELHILKRLQLSFLDDAFWLTLQPAERVNSLSWFLTPFGKGSLQQHWNMHRFQKAQEQNAIDSQSSVPMIEDATGQTEAAPLRPRKTQVSWADGE